MLFIHGNTKKQKKIKRKKKQKTPNKTTKSWRETLTRSTSNVMTWASSHFNFLTNSQYFFLLLLFTFNYEFILIWMLKLNFFNKISNFLWILFSKQWPLNKLVGRLLLKFFFVLTKWINKLYHFKILRLPITYLCIVFMWVNWFLFVGCDLWKRSFEYEMEKVLINLRVESSIWMWFLLWLTNNTSELYHILWNWRTKVKKYWTRINLNWLFIEHKVHTVCSLERYII